MLVPDAHLLFSGDFRRSGLDLVLSKDGHEFTAPNYFRGENRATLTSPDGASLSGKTVEALVGQVDYAQAGGTIAPDKVIGQVTKVSGSATVIRNGVSITLNIGDNVHKNDVVQSGSDSSLGLTFVDGTVFGLASNARMVLNEMVYNPSGADNSSLLTLVQGTISFVAGATAKNGGMKVETPTATMGIRGTAVLVEIDFDVLQPGLAPPVSFRILVEPNGHIGEYVLLDKATLQPIATVNQPGTKTVVNGQGIVTFVQSADLPSSAQRLINEIFTLKFTDANPKNIGIPPLDSITPDSFVLRLADGTPVNQLPILLTFVLQEAPSGPPPNGGNTRFHLNIPPELIATSNYFGERLLTTGNSVLDVISGNIHFNDINPEDRPTVTAQFNSFVYRNAEQAIVTSSLTLEQLAAISAVAVPLSVIADDNNTNIGDATWTYSVPDRALDFLAEGETLTLTYMARVDTNYIEYNTIVFRPFTITITGKNDLASVTVTGSGIIELDGTNNPDIDHAEGIISFADVDLTDRPTVTAPFVDYVYKAANGSTLTLTAAQLASLAPSLTLTPAAGNTNNGTVAWSYDVVDADFDFIAAGETLVLNYIAIVDDHHGGVVSVPLTLTITVRGTNDLPTITATSDGFIELVGTGNTTVDHADGTITFADVDLTDRPTISAPFSGYTYKAANGTTALTLTPAQLDALAVALTLAPSPTNANNGTVTWSYDLADNKFDFLAANETLVLTYTATVNDGHGGIVTTPITVTVRGTNDVPSVEVSDVTGAVTEAVTPAGNLTDTGTIAFTDVDLTDTHSISPTIVASTGALGMLTASVTTDTTGSGLGGVVTWNYSVAASAIEYLAKDQIKVEQFTITLEDGNGATVTRTIEVTITGTNDNPVVATADVTGAVTEAVTPTGNLADTGTIAFTDVDLTDTHSISPVIVASTGALGSLTASVTTDTTGSGLGGVVTWNYSVAASAVEYLAKDQIKVEQFTITLDDGNGGTVTRTIEVTITGTNDNPVVATANVTGALTESVTPAGNLTDTGTIAFTDVDLTDTHSISPVIVASTGALGSLTASVTTDTTGSGLGGVVTWNYSVAASTVEYLAKDQIKVEQFTITLDDGNGGTITRTIEITITGTNDDPVVATADVTGAVTEAVTPTGNLTDTGTIAFTDVDLNDIHSISPTIVASTGALGTLTASVTTDTTGSGLGGVVTWNYSVAASAVEYLAKDQIKVEQFTITLSDGNGGTITRTIDVTITGTNDAPVVATADVTGAVTEAVTPAGNLTDTGTIAFTDVDLDDIHSISPTIVASTGALGTLTASVTTDTTGSGLGGVVTWNYSVAASAVEYLAKDQIKVEQFTITLSDGNGGTITRTIDVTITGTNDAPVVATADVTGAVTEPVTPAGNLTDTGTIAFTDVDLNDIHSISPTIVASTGALGTLTASVTTDTTGSGLGGIVTWNYSVAASAVEYLARDQVKVQQFTITLNDGKGGTVTRTIEVTITGTNDAPVVATSDLTGAVNEGATSSGNLTDAGTIAFTDVDRTDTHAIQPNIVASQGALGTLTANVTTDSTGSGVGGVVTWNYSVAASDVQYLASNETKIEQFDIKLEDGKGGIVTRTVEVTLTGTNDGPEITSADPQATTYSIGQTGSSDPVGAAGSLGFADVDRADSHALTYSYASYATTAHSVPLATYQALATAFHASLNDSTGSGLGAINWSFGLAGSYFDFLGYGETLTVVYNVKIADAQAYEAKTVTVTVTGSNHLPAFTAGSMTAMVDMATTMSIANPAAPIDVRNGTFGFADSDRGDTHTVSVSAQIPVWTGGDAEGLPGHILGALANALTASVQSDSSASGFGVIAWNFTISDSFFNFMSAGQTLTLAYDITITDSHQESAAPTTVTITVNGADKSITYETLGNIQATIDQPNLALFVNNLDDPETTNLAVWTPQQYEEQNTDFSYSGSAPLLLVNASNGTILVELYAIKQLNFRLGSEADTLDLSEEAGQPQRSIPIIADGGYSSDNVSFGNAYATLPRSAFTAIFDTDGSTIIGIAVTRNVNGADVVDRYTHFETFSGDFSTAFGSSLTLSLAQITAPQMIAESHTETAPELASLLVNIPQLGYVMPTPAVGEAKTASFAPASSSGANRDDTIALHAYAHAGDGFGNDVFYANGQILTTPLDGAYKQHIAISNYDEVRDRYQFTSNGQITSNRVNTDQGGSTYAFSWQPVANGLSGDDGFASGVATASVSSQNINAGGGNDTIILASDALGGDGGIGGDGAPGQSAGLAGRGQENDVYVAPTNSSWAGYSTFFVGVGSAFLQIFTAGISNLAGPILIGLNQGGVLGQGSLSQLATEAENFFNNVAIETDSELRLDHIEIYNGGTGGASGNGGNGGDGGAATATQAHNVIDAGTGSNTVTLHAKAIGGAGGRGGAVVTGVLTETFLDFGDADHPLRLTSGSGAVAGAVGRGGHGGDGGAATSTIAHNIITSPGSGSNIQLSATAEGGDGGNGENGGDSSFGLFVNWVQLETSGIETRVYTYGRSGDGGNGGNGGNAVASIHHNNVAAGGGNDIIGLTAIAEAGAAGLGGQAGNAFGYPSELPELLNDHSEFQQNITIHAGTSGNVGAHGQAGGATASIENNVIDGGGGNDIVSIFLKTLSANDIVLRGNHIAGGEGNDSILLTAAGNTTLAASGNTFAGGGGSDTLNLVGWERGVALDFSAGTIRLDAASAVVSGTVSGFETILGTGHADTFNFVGGGVRVSGGAGTDSFNFGEGFGSATITDFGANDVINIDHDLAQSVSGLLASAHAINGSDTAVTDSAGNTIVFAGMSVAQLNQHAANFHLV